eukprot:jgi/Psemu1/309117/fgenesh1_kg.476_\
MIASPRYVAAVASGSLALLAVLLSALPTTSNAFDVLALIPPEILGAVPDECQDSDAAEFPVAVNCAMANLAQCSGILSVMPVFEEIPSAENVTECVDVQEPYCAIATTCPPCMEDFDALVRCMVLNSDGIDMNVTELVDSCSL